MTILATVAPRSVPVPTGCPRPLRPVRAAVVGLGRAGIEHTAILSMIPDCELVGVADSRKAARRNLRGMGFDAACFETPEKLLEEAGPGAVFVCAPPRERTRCARLALEAGAAVLIDRPLAPTLAEAEDLAHLAAEKGLPLACGHSLAFHPVFAHAQSVLASGALGAARQVRSSMYLSRVFSAARKRLLSPDSASGGVLAQAACDLLFVLVWLVGTPVTARATSKTLYGESEDELHAMMALPGGAEVGLDCSWSVPGYPRPAVVIEFEGENGKLLASDDAIEIELIEPRAGLPEGRTLVGRASLPQWARFDLEGEALYLLDASFLAWATGGAAPPNRAELALKAHRAMEAILSSARQAPRETVVPE